MRLYFATKNPGKVHSIRRELSDYGIELVHAPLDFREPSDDLLDVSSLFQRSHSPAEIEQIAKGKVHSAYGNVRQPVIAIDSGLYIPSLNGFPGAYINPVLKRYGVKGILDLLDGKPRECTFRNGLAYLDEDGSDPLYFESVNEGSIAREPHGELSEYCWSPLWLIFQPKGAHKVRAQLSDEEYRKWKESSEEESVTSRLLSYLEQAGKL